MEHLRPWEKAKLRHLEKLRHLKVSVYIGELGGKAHTQDSRDVCSKSPEKNLNLHYELIHGANLQKCGYFFFQMSNFQQQQQQNHKAYKETKTHDSFRERK